MFKPLIAFFFTLSLSGMAQKFGAHQVSLTPEKKENILFNDSAYRESMRARYKDKFMFELRLDDFIDENVEDAKDDFKSNLIYTDLKEEQEYVDKVIRKTIPAGYQSESVKIYLARDPETNAFCKEDGSIFINAGLLAFVNTEAELASVLAHEYGHYYHMHALRSFKKFQNAGIFSSIFYRLWPIFFGKYFYHVRTYEKQSDQMAVTLFTENNYSPDGILNNFDKFSKMDKLWKKHFKYKKSKTIFNTHPPSDKRLRSLKKNVKKIARPGKNNFQVDSAVFARVKQRAADECIWNYFENFDYDNCIELAYLMHLRFPEDEYYVQLLTEALRKKLALFPAFREDVFITGNYKLRNEKVSINKTSRSIHYHLDDIYGAFKAPNEEFANKQLSDPQTIEFVTSSEALAYFIKLAETKFSGCYTTLRRMGKPCQVPETVNSELEKYFYEMSFYRRKTTDSIEARYPFFLNNLYFAKAGKKEYSCTALREKVVEHDEFFKFLDGKSVDVKASLDSLATFSPVLTYRESNIIHPMMNLISEKVIADHFDAKKKIRKKYIFKNHKKGRISGLNTYFDLPELYLMAKKYNYRQLYFADFVVSAPFIYISGENIESANKLNVLLYCVDFEKNIVSRFYRKFNFRFNNEYELWNFYPDLINYVKDVKKKMDH
jgi:Zn-dependent protease with chaperone function